MMNNKKTPLSKKIGEWDNGPSDQQQKENTYNEIKRVFNSDKEFHEMLKSDKLQINIRGSVSKNDETTESDDMDIQVVLPHKYDLKEYKDKIWELFKKAYGNNRVMMGNIAIHIKKNINIRNVDLIVCKHGDQCVIALNNKTNEEIKFYPTLDTKRINELDNLNNKKYTKMVRTIKSCRTEFINNEKYDYKIKSFMIECLLAYCNKKVFKNKYDDDQEKDNLKRFNALHNSLNSCLNNKSYKYFKELNGIKLLFADNKQFNDTKKFFSDMYKYVKNTYKIKKKIKKKMKKKMEYDSIEEFLDFKKQLKTEKEEKDKKLKRKNIQNKIINNILKYSPFLIFLFGFIFKDFFSNENLEINLLFTIICSFVPMVISIIGISLSIQHQKIYGVYNFEFRRVRRDLHYSFLEMMLISIFIFLILFLFNYYKLTGLNWLIIMISFYYSMIFSLLEIPVICHDNKTINKIIKESLKYYDLVDYQKGISSDGVKIDDILRNSIFNDGIVSTYNTLKNPYNEAEFCDELFGIQFEFFYDFNDWSKLTNGSVYLDIQLDKAIEISFSDFENIFSFNNNFDITKIFDGFNCIHYVTRPIFNIQRLLNMKGADEIFEKNINQLIYTIFTNLSLKKEFNENNRKFIYFFLNCMIKETIKNEQLWFAKALRDGQLLSLICNDEVKIYFFYYSMILYFYCELDKSVPNSLKENLNTYLNEESNDINAKKLNFYEVFEDRLRYFDTNGLILCLNKLINYYEVNDDDFFGFQFESRGTSKNICAGYPFTYKDIVDCWLQLVLSKSDNFEIRENIVKDAFNLLNDKYIKLITKYLMSNYFNSDKTIFKKEYINFYKYNGHLYEYDNANGFIKQLFREVNDLNKIFNKPKNNNIKEHVIEYSDDLTKTLNEIIKNHFMYDKDLNIEDGQLFNYVIIEKDFDITNSKDTYINIFDNIISGLITNFFENKDNLNIYNGDEKIDLSIYQFKNYNEYVLDSYNIGDEEKENIKGMKIENIYIKSCILWKKGAFKLKVEFDKNNKIYNELSREEINKIIEENYTVRNGLYKYARYNNAENNMFLTKSELYDIIKCSYYKIILKFKFKIEIASNEYIIFKDKLYEEIIKDDNTI